MCLSVREKNGIGGQHKSWHMARVQIQVQYATPPPESKGRAFQQSEYLKGHL